MKKIKPSFQLVYLLLMTCILPLSVLYLKQENQDMFGAPYMLLTLVVVFPTWLIIYLSLGMSRFPNKIGNGALTVLGFILQIIFFALYTDASILKLFYGLFISSLLGITLFLIWSLLPVHAFKENKKSIIFSVASLAVILIPIIHISLPFIKEIAHPSSIFISVILYIVFTINILTSAYALSPHQKHHLNNNWNALAGITTLCIIISFSASIVISTLF